MKKTSIAKGIGSLILMLVMASLTFNASAQTLNTKQLIAEYDKMLSEQFKPGETGCAALVAKNGQIIYKKAFGMANLEINVPMQPDMVFRIGSITKQFTSMAILQLMEQGKLSLQDEITKFIPGYPTHGHAITIEHLLTHTSGIKSYTNVPEYQQYIRTDLKPDEILDIIKTLPMEFAPGTKYNYNNSGFFLLGYIIEKVSDKTYQEYLQQNFFTPLGMTGSCYGNDTKIIKNRASGYKPGNDGPENANYLSMLVPFSAGAIQSTVEDLFKWNQAVHSYRLVKKETLDKAFAEYKLPDGKGTGYGYGWFLSQIKGSPSIEHGGGINGFLTNAIYLPEEDVFVALFSNNEGKAPTFTSLKMAALAIGKPLETTVIELDDKTLEQYIGVYEDEEGTQRMITREESQMFFQRAGSTKLKIMPSAKDKFFFENSFVTISFNRDALGNVVESVTDVRGSMTTLKKTDKPLPTRKEIVLSEDVLSQYVGEYELQPGFTMTFTHEGNRFFIQATGQQRFEVFAESETKFFLKLVDAQVEFVKDETGKVNKLIFNQGGQRMEAKRIK